MLAVCAGGGCLAIFFSLSFHFSSLSPSPWETARYRLKYCRKGPLNPKQQVTQTYKTDLDFGIVLKGQTDLTAEAESYETDLNICDNSGKVSSRLLTLKEPSKIAADDTFFFYLSKKIKLDVI